MLRVALPPARTDAGAIETMGPPGATPAARLTVWAMPLATVVKIALEPLPPWTSEIEGVPAEMEKSLAGIDKATVVL